MIALGIDTSTPDGSVAAVRDDGDYVDLRWRGGHPHSRRLTETVRTALDWIARGGDTVDIVAVAAGPGGFTGLRVGMATAKGLGLAEGCPVAGFSTLESLAMATASMLGGGGATIAVLQDAGRREIYRGVYRCDGRRATALEVEAALPVAQAMAGLPAGTIVCGSASVTCRGAVEPLLPPGARILGECPAIGATLARRGLALLRERSAVPPLLPNYLRASDAETARRF